MRFPPLEFFDHFKKIPGALSCCESIALANIAEQAVGDGMWIELGSHKGKSCVSATFFRNSKKDFYLVDPIFVDEEICKEVYKNVNEYCNPIFLPDYSTNIIELYSGYSYVLVDSGSHGDGLPMQEAKLLEDRMRVGGTIAWHDYLSQFSEVEQSYNYLLGTGKYETVHIDWATIIGYVREHKLEEGNNSWHHNELEFPCFLGALRKIR